MDACTVVLALVKSAEEGDTEAPKKKRRSFLSAMFDPKGLLGGAAIGGGYGLHRGVTLGADKHRRAQDAYEKLHAPIYEERNAVRERAWNDALEHEKSKNYFSEAVRNASRKHLEEKNTMLDNVNALYPERSNYTMSHGLFGGLAGATLGAGAGVGYNTLKRLITGE